MVPRASQKGLTSVCWKLSGTTTVWRCGEVDFCFSYAPKNHAWSVQSGPPRVYDCVGFKWSNFTRAFDAPVTWFFVLFCEFQLSFEPRNFAEPLKLLPPDFVMTLTMAPVARPYSAETPEV